MSDPVTGVADPTDLQELDVDFLLDDDEAAAQDEPEFRCPECGLEVRTRAGLARHRSLLHEVQPRWGPAGWQRARESALRILHREPSPAVEAYRAAWKAERRRRREALIRPDIRERVERIRAHVLGALDGGPAGAM